METYGAVGWFHVTFTPVSPTTVALRFLGAYCPGGVGCVGAGGSGCVGAGGSGSVGVGGSGSVGGNGLVPSVLTVVVAAPPMTDWIPPF